MERQAVIESPMLKAWKRLKKNKPAMVSLGVIIIAVFLAIFGPAMAPDATPFADDQVLEISQQKPGFQTKMMLDQKNRNEKHRFFLAALLLGRENSNTMVPINSWKIVKDSVEVVVFRGELETETKKYGLVDVFYPLSISNKKMVYDGDKVVFNDAKENTITASISDLAKRFEKERIITKKYRLGTDNYGRDILSRLLYGVRVSISVGFVAVLISLTIGIFLGAIAGFYKDDALKTTLPKIISFILSLLSTTFLSILFFKKYTISFLTAKSLNIEIGFLFTIIKVSGNLVIFLLVVFAMVAVFCVIYLLLNFILSKLLSMYKKQYALPVDSGIMWLINVVWSIPTILLAMSINFALGNFIDSFWVIYIAVGLSMWVEVARVVRGQVLGIREMEYVQAARGLGYNDNRIIFKHILPNILGPIMVITSANFASAILIEAGLSFVGIGAKPPMPSWGTMLNEYRAYLTIPGKTFLALYPGLAIAVLVLAFNLLGNGLSDAFDVKGKTNS
ncbi:MAG: ABC transporter permease [Chitinophagales bacterium]|nr:ABC transporter permease [Chitinophagales bacterium]